MPISALAPTDDFLAAADALGIAFDPGDLERLGRYLALLAAGNERMNLTRIVDPADAWMRHVLDSLTLLPILAGLEATAIADVGPGGGLPSLPLAITMPDATFTLIEATGKKAAFLEETARALDLENVAVVNARAEDAGQDRAHHREQYDAVVARAVGPLPVLLELTVPLVRVGGFVVAIKGEQAEREIDDAAAALRTLHAEVVDTVRTPTGTIVVVSKTRATGKVYPRRPGEPKRDPL